MPASDTLWDNIIHNNNRGVKPAAFVGRKALLQSLVRGLRNPQENIFYLYGSPRIGKTTILQQLAKWLPKAGAFRPVYFDLSGKATWPLARLLEELTEAIAKALRLPPPSPNTDPETNFRQIWLPAALSQLPAGVCLILLLDEFKNLPDEKAHQTTETFYAYLRSIVSDHPQQLKCLITLDRTRDRDNFNQEGQACSPLQATSSYRVTPFGWDETLELIETLAKEYYLKWSEDALARLWSLTYGHPALIKQLYQHIWEGVFLNPQQFLFREKPHLTYADVEAAASDLLAVEKNLEWFWQGLLSTEQWVLSKLAMDGGDRLRQTQANQTVEIYTPLTSQRALQQLSDWELIEADNGRGYELCIGLISRWIQQYNPIVSVTSILAASTELSEMATPVTSTIQAEPSPGRDTPEAMTAAAENLYQAALTLYEKGSEAQAAAMLRHALRLDANHVQASQLLREILCSMDAADAMELFEALYEIETPHQLSESSGSQAILRREVVPTTGTIPALQERMTVSPGVIAANQQIIAAADQKIQQMQANITSLQEQLEAERKAHAKTKWIAEQEVRQLWAQLKTEVSALRQQLEAERKAHAETQAKSAQEIKQLKQRMAFDLAMLQSQLEASQQAQRGTQKTPSHEMVLLHRQTQGEAPASQYQMEARRQAHALRPVHSQEQSKTQQPRWTSGLERLWDHLLKSSPEKRPPMTKRGFVSGWF